MAKPAMKFAAPVYDNQNSATAKKREPKLLWDVYCVRRHYEIYEAKILSEIGKQT
jgi:hypothetical protein